MDTNRPIPRPARPVPQPAKSSFKLGRAAFLTLLGGTGVALLAGKKALPDINVSSFVPSVASVNGFTIYTVTEGYPAFNPATYRLRIDGMVEKPLTFGIDELLKLPAVTETRFYQCVTGWTVPNARWTGVRLAWLLDQARPQAGAHALTFYSFDGVYTESLTMEQARRRDVLLAYKLNNKPLAREQGAPLRLAVPGMYGYKFIKWVNRVELVPAPVEGYWEQNGYDRDAWIGRSNGV